MELERRVELDLLFDFYGALLTPRRQEIMRLRVEEDMTLAELGDALGITRQAAGDALARTEEVLREYEARLGLLRRWRVMREAAQDCLSSLDRLEQGDRTGLPDAKAALQKILDSER